MPDVLWDAFESLLETIWFIFLFDADSSNIVDFSDENQLYPIFVFAITGLKLVLRLLVRLGDLTSQRMLLDQTE